MAEGELFEELLLELRNTRIVEKDGTRRAKAEAALTYIPADKTQRVYESEGRFVFTAPLGAIEKEELSWYLERYYLWPIGVFQERAKKLEKQLPEWGAALYDAVFKRGTVQNVLDQWNNAKSRSPRRFTVMVDSRVVEGIGEEEQKEAAEAAALLLSLPWELMHHEGSYFFQGAKQVQVRRRLPFSSDTGPEPDALPVRVLLVSPRPEDKTAGYIDHRISALPLVTALETLGKAAEFTILTPPTLPGLDRELRRANDEGTPYHAVHFDGHGVYSKEHGLGGLCFERPGDEKRLKKRRSQLVMTDKITEIMHKHRIPLFFLEACQSAQMEKDPTASVAAALLKGGVASVVAMSHSVLVETAKRFVTEFYKKICAGSTVGKAMVAGRNELKNDSYRLKIFGAGRLELQDWFVPVLYQEHGDEPLIRRLPDSAVQDVMKTVSTARFGALPKEPVHGFTGRSRELLQLERLLIQTNYAVIRGQGGEGKTTLAVEAARWLVRCGRFDRAVFVCMEDVNDFRGMVDELGRQLVHDFTVAVENDLEQSLVKLLEGFRKERVLVVLDNMETILPGVDGSVSNGKTELMDMARFEPGVLEQLFGFCERVLDMEGSALIFTSREVLSPPFDVGFNRLDLSRMSRSDAVELVHGSMRSAGLEPVEDDKTEAQPEVEELVAAVNCHARSLVLLAPYINDFGVRKTTEQLVPIMAELHKKYPEERERSLFASVELSLRRLSPGIRDRIAPLGLFQGGGHQVSIQHVLELTDSQAEDLVRELHGMGLAEPVAYGFYRFHPALCPYLLRQMTEAQISESMPRWVDAMGELSGFLYQQSSKDAQLSATLTTLELPNLVRLLDVTASLGEAEKTVGLATKLEGLIAPMGRPHLLTRVAAVREREAADLPDWSNTRFNALWAQVERLMGCGQLPRALQEAQALLDRCLQAGDGAYGGAAYDTATVYLLLGRILKNGGGPAEALPVIDEAFQRFRRLADQGNERSAIMASVSLTVKGDCLRDLGRLQESAAAYEAGIKISEELDYMRGTAVSKGQLGTVRLYQKRYDDALDAYDDALKLFGTLGEPASVAVFLHQKGMANQAAGRFEAAEQAYRRSLAIEVRQNNPAGEADSLIQLGNLYSEMDRLEEAAIFCRQAADKYIEINDMAKEGFARNNLADTLIKLKRYDEARREIQRAIACKEPYGHAATPWNVWDILCDLEQVCGNRTAADAARLRARQLYLDYRRDGGENHEPGGRLCHDLLPLIREDKHDEAAAVIDEYTNRFRIAGSSLEPLIPKLRDIVAGSRDPRLAEDGELRFDNAAEILFMLEMLG